MRRRWRLLAWLELLGLAGVLLAAEAGLPKLDKRRLETYLRYAEGFSSAVTFEIDDPSASPFKGYYRVVVHLSNGASRLDRVYYVTADGQRFVNGSIWDLNSSPFIDNAEHLPKTGFSFGPENAKVTLMVFSDFQCPYCRELAKTLREHIPQKYPNDVRVVFENFPLESIHKWARAAAEAGECLGRQKPEAFWSFHDWIFDHQQEVSEGNVKDKALTIAKLQNVDMGKVSACIDTHATAEDITRSIKAGQALQIQETPTSFVNGRMLAGAMPWANVEAIIQIELDRPGEVPGIAQQKCCEVSMPSATKK